MIEWSKFGYPKRLDENGMPIPCGNTAPWETWEGREKESAKRKAEREERAGVGKVVDTSLAGVVGGGVVDAGVGNGGMVIVDSAKPGPRNCIVDKGKFVRTFDFAGMRQFDPWEFGKKTVDMAGLQGDGDWKRVCAEMLLEKGLDVVTHCVDTQIDTQNTHIRDSGTALVILVKSLRSFSDSGSGDSGFLDGGTLNPEKVPAVLYWSQEKHVVVLTYIKTDLGLLQAELLFADWVQYLVAAKAAYIARQIPEHQKPRRVGGLNLGGSAGTPSLGLPAAILAPRKGAGGA